MRRLSPWALCFLALAGCVGTDVELLSARSITADASISESADAGAAPPRRRPPPENPPPPEEPLDFPISGDAGVAVPEVPDGGAVDAPPPTTIQWLKKPALPIARGALGVAAFGQMFHVLGGDVDYEGVSPATAHRVFDVRANGYAPRAVTPDNNQWGPCVVVHENYLYAFGGWSKGAGVLRRYDFELDEWKYLPPSPGKQMWGFACALVDGVLYVISGTTDAEGDKPTEKVNAFNIATQTWTQKANYPAKVVDLTGAAIGSRIYVLGRKSTFDIYDTVTNKWSTGPSIGRDAARSLAVAHKGMLYVFGGKSSDKVNRFDPQTNTWSELPAMSTPRGNAAGASVGNEIHLFGGFPTPTAATDLHEALYIP